MPKKSAQSLDSLHPGKMFGAATYLDNNNHVVWHFCDDTPGCFHCEQYPFKFPPAELYPRIADKTLTALEARARRQIEEARAALIAIAAERIKREV